MTERPSHRVFAALYDPATRPFESRIVEHREYLTEGVGGDALDLGAGTGANFPYFADTDAQLHAVEPDPYMLKRAKERARNWTSKSNCAPTAPSLCRTPTPPSTT